MIILSEYTKRRLNEIARSVAMQVDLAMLRDPPPESILLTTDASCGAFLDSVVTHIAAEMVRVHRELTAVVHPLDETIPPRQ
jgi:hypothetical protein